MVTQKDVDLAEEIIRQYRFGPGTKAPVRKIEKAFDTVLELIARFEEQPKQAAGVTHWKPIAYSKLPEEGEEVLVTVAPNGVHGKKVEIDCFMNCDIKYWQSGKILAWMPKPKAYGEE